MKKISMMAAAIGAVAVSPAVAAQPEYLNQSGPDIKIDPIVAGRLRFEAVDTSTLDARAATLRMRAGAEIKHSIGLSFLAEAEATSALVQSYSPFPFPTAESRKRAGFAVVADPANIELNRLQIQRSANSSVVTLGRQRINLDDQRFIGSVGWRQNEQTFDALRGETKLGPVGLDASYAISQRTVFGKDAEARAAFDGRFIFLGAGTKLGSVNVKGFAYLLDFDFEEQKGALAISNADTQTYGARVTGRYTIGSKTSINLAASHARQFSWKQNPNQYATSYLAGEAALSHGSASVTAGYEQLSGDGSHGFQTPMATLHKFNGWADLFLTTPGTGLRDWYGGVAFKFAKGTPLPGLGLEMSFHKFSSYVIDVNYGTECDASVSFKIGRANLLAKLADYRADRYGKNTRKVWLQMEFAY